MSNLRKFVGLGFSALFDIALGLDCAFVVGWFVHREVTLSDYGVATIIMLLPDTDVLAQNITKGKVTGEHRNCTHYPLLIVPIVTFAVWLVSGQSLFWSLVALSCLLAHFIHDTCERGPGVAWLAPFKPEKYRRWRLVNGRMPFKMTSQE